MPAFQSYDTEDFKTGMGAAGERLVAVQHSQCGASGRAWYSMEPAWR